MRRAACLLTLCLTGTLAPPASGGAWPREDGGLFVSASNVIAVTPLGATSAMTSAYAEYGVTDRITAGVKYDRILVDEQAAELIGRYHLSDPDARHQLAARIGIGQIHRTETGGHTILSLGALYGLGFGTRLGPGWAEIDARGTLPANDDGAYVNADLTLGLTPFEDQHVILQARGYGDEFGTSVELAPSYVRPIWSGLKGEFGLVYRPEVKDSFGVKLGTWLEF